MQLVDTGAISAVQLEAVIYACQAHEMTLPGGERFGYLIGWCFDLIYGTYLLYLIVVNFVQCF